MATKPNIKLKLWKIAAVQIGAKTSRHRTTIMNSLFIFDSYMRDREFKNNYEKVMTLFEEYKSK